MEKYRHAPLGRTDDARAKLRQITSASLRAYLSGPETTAARHQIVVDYLNSTPLSARPGYGEVNGLGDGLWAWFGTDFALANRALSEPAADAPALALKARVYKQALSLLLAQRRPSYYLTSGRADLARLTDSYLRLMRAGGDIDARLGGAALAAELEFLPGAPAPAALPYADRKAANALRAELLSLLGMPSLYRLDRLDLKVQTALDLPTQRRVSELLRQLNDPAVARALGLYGERLLDPAVPTASLITGLTLYERGEGANYLRVQADNLDRPFDMNRGAKLDLGSTAKLRTLITYLEIVAELLRASGGAAGERAQSRRSARGRCADAVGGRASRRKPGPRACRPCSRRRWSGATRRAPGRASSPAAACTASRISMPSRTAESFTVAAAFRHSVNLVFIRLMRDIVAYRIRTDMPWAAAMLRRSARAAAPRVSRALRRPRGRRVFWEGSGTSSPASAPTARSSAWRPRVRPRPRPARRAVPLAAARGRARRARGLPPRPPRAQERRRGRDRRGCTGAMRSSASRSMTAAIWRACIRSSCGSPPICRSIRRRPAPRRWRRAQAPVRRATPGCSRPEHKSAQDKRIGILLEEQAFERIHADWRRLGYPFGQLVPSYASAIGSSADRPEALAELIGIILNNGVRQPAVRIERLHFAAATPYETVLELQPAPPAAVLAPEIAAVVRAALIDVAEQGTARRLKGAFATSAGAPIVVGAKTGTGDHRRKSFARGGRMIDAKAVSRTATVVFFLGEQFFGNLTVFAPEAVASDFRFTSSLSAELLKALAPALQPLLDRSGTRTAEAAPSGGA